MIRALVLMLLAVALVTPLSADSLLSCDKGAHSGVSFIGFGASALAFRESDDLEFKAAAVTLGLGLFKELYDLGIRRKTFSVEDLLFDVLGVLAGYAMIRVNRSLGPDSRR